MNDIQQMKDDTRPAETAGTGPGPAAGPKRDIKSMYPAELKAYLQELGEKPYRAGQVFTWMHKRLVCSPMEMTDLSLDLRRKLAQECEIPEMKVAKRLVSALDGTEKYLLELADGNIIEAVLMRYKYGLSLCVSSQVGCRMGCRFCASTIDGLVRNLTASELLEELYCIQRLRPEERISHIVMMGSGEPFDNYGNVVRFLRLVTAPEGQDLSRRNITVSTCGLVPRIYDFAKEDPGVTLALSLHAPNDEIRRRTMPVARSYSIDEILKACAFYFEKTGRRVSFEYSLIAGVNDAPEHAAELASRIRPLRAHVNLIPVNPVEERDYRSTDRAKVLAFKNLLESKGINATIRREMGRDIAGACGQLRRRHISSEAT